MTRIGILSTVFVTTLSPFASRQPGARGIAGAELASWRALRAGRVTA